MPSEYDRKDENLVKSIFQSLVNQYVINVNQSEGVAYLQGIHEDQIFPSVNIGYDEICRITGRQKMRTTVKDKFKNMLEAEGLVVFLQEESLLVQYPQIKQEGVTKFNNFSELTDNISNVKREYNLSENEYKSKEDFELNNPLRDPFS